MVNIVCVRFRTAGKIYYFDPGDFVIKKGDHVIVETVRGVEFGTSVSDIMEIGEEKIVSPLKTVIRVATLEDEEIEREGEAFKICLEKIRKHELEMKLIDAEYTFDNNKLLFYFTADGRIDFRELVKDLASVFRTRIELRQIGVRDETKILGGYGICGRPLCCHTYLSDFSPVSIKMAKEQNLSLNPTKISGVCGRLMCCLQNEEETYEDLNRRLPSIGDIVTDAEGLKGEGQSVNVLRQRVKVLIEQGDEKELHEYSVEDITFQRRRKGPKEKPLMEEEISEEELRAITDEPEISEKPEKRERPDRQKNFDKKNHDKNNFEKKRPDKEKNDKDRSDREKTDKDGSEKAGQDKNHSNAQPNLKKNFNKDHKDNNNKDNSDGGFRGKNKKKGYKKNFQNGHHEKREHNGKSE